MITLTDNFVSSQHSEYEPNLIELFRPLYILLSLLGLFPCSITFPKRKYSKIKVKSIAINSFCAAMMLLFTVAFFTVNAIPLLMSKTTLMTDITHMIEYILLTVCSFVSYSVVYKNRHAYVKMLNAISSTWTDLSSYDINYILKRFQLLVRLLLIAWLFFLMGGQTVFSSIGSENMMEVLWIVVPEMVPSGIVVFYDAMGLMVVSLLQSIQHYCRKLVKSENPNGIGIIRVQYKKSQITLIQLEIAYAKALEVKREINRVFQAAILLITIQTFHTVICEAHYVYHGLTKTENFEIFDVLSGLFRVTYQSMKIYALSIPGTYIKNEEIKIGQTLLCIPAENLNVFTEVQHFSSLMSYQGTLMTAYGYFALDATLVFNTLAAVVTYLVILVQFDS